MLLIFSNFLSSDYYHGCRSLLPMLFSLSCHIWIINSAIFDLIWSSFLFRILYNYFILTQVSSIYFILNFFSIFSFIFLATISASFAYQYFKNGPLSFTTPAPVNVNENNYQIDEVILLIISSNISLSHSHSVSIYLWMQSRYVTRP